MVKRLYKLNRTDKARPGQTFHNTYLLLEREQVVEGAAKRVPQQEAVKILQEDGALPVPQIKGNGGVWDGGFPSKKIVRSVHAPDAEESKVLDALKAKGVNVVDVDEVEEEALPTTFADFVKALKQPAAEQEARV